MIRCDANEQQTFSKHAEISQFSRAEWAQVSEEEVIRGAQRGNEAAFERIYQLHCRRVYGLCLRMTKNPADAEDLTQEAFLTVFRKIQTFRGQSAFSTWLHRIAVNLVLMRLRRKCFLEPLPEGPPELDGDREGQRKEAGCQDQLLAGTVDRVVLERAMEHLRPIHRMVVELHDIQGYKHTEIARIMDCSIGNSKAQLHRARRQLRDFLNEALRLQWLTPARTSVATFGA
ncbi:MAG: sigma-70 family RNA polymerase sigma factor [Candidatus Acidiferrum sp.]